MNKRQSHYGVIKKNADDSKQRSTSQVNYNKKQVEALDCFPFGFYAKPKINSLTLCLNIDCSNANKANIPLTESRPNFLIEGEVCVFHPETQSLIHFKKDGSVDLKTGDKQLLIEAGKVLIKSDVEIQGGLNVLGPSSFTSDITSNGKNIGDTHGHEGSPTAPNGPVSDTGEVL